MDPVIIVGAGPVGLTLALALARQEVPSVVLDEGPGKDELRLARTVVLREDTVALVERLTGLPLDDAGFHWAGWRSMRRKQVMREIAFGESPGSPEGAGGATGPRVTEAAWGEGPRGAVAARGTGPSRGAESPADGEEFTAPLHIAQHALTGALREAIIHERLIKVAAHSRLDTVEQDPSGVTAHTRGPKGTWWRGSYLVGCDGPRSTVRKLQDIRFPGRTAVERHAVAALRTELPWPGEALLHRMTPWRTSGPSAA